MTSYKTCSVPLCKSSTAKNPEKLFLHVPTCPKRRHEWLELARRNPKSTSRKSTIYFCEDHFDLPNDMENYIQYSIMGSVGKIRLNPDCLPSKFECQPGRLKPTAQSNPIVKNTSYKTCSVPLCASSTVKNPEKLFFHVPTCPKRRHEWLQLARQDPKLTSDESTIYFCEDHFDLPNDMENYTQYCIMGSVYKMNLKPDCLPSKFECQPGRLKRTTPSKPPTAVRKRQRRDVIQEILSKETQISSKSTLTSNKDVLPKGCLKTSEVPSIEWYRVHNKNTASTEENITFSRINLRMTTDNVNVDMNRISEHSSEGYREEQKASKGKRHHYYKNCSVPKCGNNNTRTPDKVFISVSKKSNIRAQWLTLAGRNPDKLVDVPNVFFCEDHFYMEVDAKNYSEYKMGESPRLFLVDGAVPSRFDCQDNPKEKVEGIDTSPSRLAFTKPQQIVLIQRHSNKQPTIIRKKTSTLTTDVSTRGCLKTSAVSSHNLPHSKILINMEEDTRLSKRKDEANMERIKEEFEIDECVKRENFDEDYKAYVDRIRKEIDAEEYVKEDNFEEDSQEGNILDMESNGLGFEFVEIKESSIEDFHAEEYVWPSNSVS